MNNNAKICMYLVMGGVMSMAMAQSTEAEAKNRSSRFKYNKYGHHHRGSYGYRHNSHVSGGFVFSIPRGFIKISVGGKKYHYHDGAYYRKGRHGYNVVSAPIGACIEHLPHGYQKYHVDGVPYYTYNDVYYKHTRGGYEVIHQPYSRHTKKSRVRNDHRDHDEGNSITLSIRNKEGGYFSITVKPSGDGYVGPQGEYYDQFPKIEHLKLIYGS